MTEYESFEDFLLRARAGAIQWARDRLQRPFLILDTETTGLDTGHNEIIEIAVLSSTGDTRLDMRIRPAYPDRMEAGAMLAHGISMESLRDCPPFKQVYPHIRDALNGSPVVVYNAAYDGRMLAGDCQRDNIPAPDWRAWECAMQQYARFVGEWNDYHQSFRWQKLPGGDHSALGDCRATLAIIQEMAAARA